MDTLAHDTPSLVSRDAWRAARAAGIARVERYYADSMMFGAYQKVYDKALGLPATVGGPA